MNVLLSIVLALPVALQPQAAAPPSAEAQPVAAVTQVSGEVLVRHGQAWARVDKVPMNLVSGDTVTTDRGRAEVHFLADDSTLVLDVGTYLSISETPTRTGWLRRVEIFLGDVWFHMQHSLKGNTELATPTAVGGLRGTQGLIHVENENQSNFTLSEGELEIAQVAGAGGGPDAAKGISLHAGETLQASRNKPLHVSKAAALPARPAVNVPANQLPKPRANWRELMSKDRRPPAVSRAPAVSSRPAAPGKAATPAKPGQTTKPVKNAQQHKPPSLR